MKNATTKTKTRPNVFWVFDIQKQKAKQMFLDFFSFIKQELQKKTKHNYPNSSQNETEF